MAGPRKATGKDEGKDDGGLKGARVLVVEGRYYDEIADELLAGAKRALDAAKVDYDVATVPGALEVPQAVALALDAAAKRKAPYDGAVALGCVVRGETFHFEIVAGESARALMDMSVDRRLALGNGILTTETIEQAEERADPARGDKGGEAARAAVGLADLERRLGRR